MLRISFALELLIPVLLLVSALVVAVVVALQRKRHMTALKPVQPPTRTLTHDKVTGIYKRELFLEVGEKAVDLARRHTRDLSLCLLEIDGFKALQGEHGSAAGDELLQQTSARVQHLVRNADVTARVAAARIAILMPETDLEGAQALTRRLQAQMRDTPFRTNAQSIRMTASFGLAGLTPGETEITTLLARAELALVQARRLGRDRVSLA